MIIKTNRTFLTWTGYDGEALIGRRKFQELLSRGDRIFYDTHFGPALAMQGKVREIAVDLVTADGGRLPVLVNSVLIKDEHGSPRVIRTAVFDARERRSYERELVAARERAEASEAKARALAATLQASFLPPTILEIPGLDVAGAYRPAGDGSEVGGDFYDVFATSDERWGIVLGDVSGKGAPAAALTGIARYAVRAEAMRSTSAAEVLGGVHRALLSHDGGRFCTAVFLVVDRIGGGHRLTIASGGHHLPILVDPTGGITQVGEVGSILGMLDEVDLRDSAHELEDGSTLVLYTDGVVEARNHTGFFGEERLYALLRELRQVDAQQMVDAIVDDTLLFQQGNPRDDIAVVAIKR